ncbi:hypothetical protein PRK78_000832 [Emydomyces testavorans]|uniref:Uncharacterized protein n=1 Tax=Emydomyces testavorans TaxID=2070801 RepID=A0AAF0DCS0_9EURO|nr:hypothetical protein PRK78_000832 [Emydomyces testavorans]
MGARKAPLDVKSLKTERTHAENQERAFIAASRRGDRTLDARFESAQRASRIHKVRTGRALRITLDAVKNEEMYEEEDDDHHRQKFLLHLESQNARLTRELNLDHSFFLRSARHGIVGYPYYSAVHPHPYQAHGNGVPSGPQGYQMHGYAPSYGQGARTAPVLYTGANSWVRPQVHSRSMSIATPEASQMARGGNLTGVGQSNGIPWPGHRSVSTPSTHTQAAPQAVQPRVPTPNQRSNSQTPVYVGMPSPQQPVLKPRPQRLVRFDQLGEQQNGANGVQGETPQYMPLNQPQIRRYTVPQVQPMDQLASGATSPDVPMPTPAIRHPGFETTLANNPINGQVEYWNTYMAWLNSTRPEIGDIMEQSGATVTQHSNQTTGVAPTALASHKSGTVSRSSSAISSITETSVQELDFVSQPSKITDISAAASTSPPPPMSLGSPDSSAATAIAQGRVYQTPAESKNTNIGSNAQAISSKLSPISLEASSSSLSTEFLPNESLLNKTLDGKEPGLSEAAAPDLLFEDSVSPNSSFAESAFGDGGLASADLSAGNAVINSSFVQISRRDSLESISGTEITKDQWQECFNNGFWKESTFDNSAFMPVAFYDE